MNVLPHDIVIIPYLILLVSDVCSILRRRVLSAWPNVSYLNQINNCSITRHSRDQH